ncbi:MAG TPA: basic amino acid ABC transporter substrate-binding protein [Syntrophomonadaceae bacterium]|nr:basic amino acid ABC transporter substrate-binding protein [Syntrophomonadaceae bacterium]
MKKFFTWCLAIVFLLWPVLQHPGALYATGQAANSRSPYSSGYETPSRVTGTNIAFPYFDSLSSVCPNLGMVLAFVLHYTSSIHIQSDPAAPEPTIRPRGQTITILSETTYPPFEYVENGKYQGFDIDLIKAICASQGYDMEIQSTSFDALIPGLQAGKADCAISAMSINPARTQVVDFTQPYLVDGSIIAVRSDDESIKGLSDLYGKKLAAELGTPGQETCNQLNRQDPATQVLACDILGEALAKLENGEVDAVISQWSLIADHALRSGKIKPVGKLMEPYGLYGILVKKGNTDTLSIMQQGMAELRVNGLYDDLVQKWFGGPPPMD